MNNRTWSPEEEQILKDYFPAHGSKCFEAIGHVIDRTPFAICAKAKKLGVRYNHLKPRTQWDEHDIEMVRQHYNKGIHVLLPYLSKDYPRAAIKTLASKLGVTNSNFLWSPEEDEILYKHYRKLGTHCADLLPNRSRASVISRAKRLGLVWASDVWQPDEDAVIRRLYAEHGPKAVHGELPHRTVAAIGNRARMIGVRYHGPRGRRPTHHEMEAA